MKNRTLLALHVCVGMLSIAFRANADLSTSEIRLRPAPDTPPGKVQLNVMDEKGTPMAARVWMQRADAGRDDYVDLAGRNLLVNHAFVVDGSVTSRIDPGEYRISAAVGVHQTYAPAEALVAIEADKGYRIDIRLARWFHPERMGWYSVDMHLHSYRYGNLAIHTDDPDKTFRAEQKRWECDRIDYDLVARIGRAAGLNMTVDNVCQTVSVTPEETRRLEANFSTPDALLMISSEIKYDPSGHVNVPGTRPGLLRRSDTRGPFPLRDVLRRTREEGGAMVYTHPIKHPWFLRMTAVECFSHLVQEEHGEVFDIGSGRHDEANTVMLFGLWNAGVRIGAGATSDTSIIGGVGDVRTYVRMDRLAPETMIAGLRAHRTIAAIGPVFARVQIGEAGPGDVVSPGRHSLHYEAHAFHGLQAVDVVVDGERVESIDGGGRQHLSGQVEVNLAEGSYVTVIARDEHVWRTRPRNTGLSIPTAIFAGNAPRNDKYVTVFFLNDLDRGSVRTGDYFLHLAATVHPDDAIREVRILRGDDLIRSFQPGDGGFPADGSVIPITRGSWPAAHVPSWHWDAADAGEARHMQLSHPVEGDGAYRIRIETRSGKTLDAGVIDFRRTSDSWQGGVLQLHGDNGSVVLKQWAHSDATAIGERLVASRPWHRFAELRTVGRAGAEMEFTFRSTDPYRHPATIEPGVPLRAREPQARMLKIPMATFAGTRSTITRPIFIVTPCTATDARNPGT